MTQRRAHPSGRPIRRKETRGRGNWNIPSDSPMTPRLRTPRADASAIGFRVPSLSEAEAEQLRRQRAQALMRCERNEFDDRWRSV